MRNNVTVAQNLTRLRHFEFGCTPSNVQASDLSLVQGRQNLKQEMNQAALPTYKGNQDSSTGIFGILAAKCRSTPFQPMSYDSRPKQY